VDPSIRKRVTEFLGEMVGVHFPDDTSVELRAARHDPVLMGDQIRRAWVDILDAESRAQPVLLVLEDLHWGDQPTLECVNTALRLLCDRPLMVLALARPEARQAFPGLWADRELTEIRLGELSRKACQNLVRQVLTVPVTDEGVQAIVERSAGNAFFLEELLRAAAEGQKGDVPATVLAVMQARLADLGAEARRALRAASVFGQVFWRGALDALLGDASSPGQIDALLADLERRELITRLPVAMFRGEAEYAFRHALVREAAYGMLTDEDRALGHRLAGAWLELAGESDATVLAAHAERGGARARAAALYGRAAAEALWASDLDAAVARVKRAIECGAEGDVLGSAKWIEAEVHNWRGDFTEGARSGREAMRLLPCATSSWYASAAAVAWATLVLGDHAQLVEVASELARQIPLAPPSTGQLVSLARVLVGLYRAGLVRDAGPLFEALSSAPEALRSVPMVTAHTEEVLAWRATWARDRVASYQGFLLSAEAFERAGDARNHLRTSINASVLRILLGEYADAERDLRAALELSGRLGLSNITAGVKENLGLALARQGALEEARWMQLEAIAAFSVQGDRGQESAARSYLAEIQAGLGQIEEAEREARQAVVLASAAPGLQCYALAVLAQVLLARDRAEEALEHAQQAMSLLTELGGVEEGEALVRLSLAEALRANGASERAREAIRAARDSVLAAAASIDDPERRRSFLENIPENARTLTRAQRWLDEDKASAAM
jgi:tetratricopeptide (TPR) repeat protein